MRNKFYLFLIALFLFAMGTFPKTAYASGQMADTSATLATETVSAQQVKDNRGKVLEMYLAQKNSPLQGHADLIINYADKNELDWKLLPSIAGVESTYCNEIPTNSYNCWGFGIYGDHVRYFNSWEDAISTISASLKNDYIDKGATTVGQIGKIYAASPTWASRVESNITDLNQFSTKYADSTLSISL